MRLYLLISLGFKPRVASLYGPEVIGPREQEPTHALEPESIMNQTSLPTRVSIVSVYYNREKYVGYSIRSLIDQTYANTEIVIVDDGSTDQTWTELQKFAGYPNVKLIRQENEGFTAAINTGIRASTGKYVAVHGSGDVSYPKRIEKQAAILDQVSDVVLVSCIFENGGSQNAQFQKVLSDLDRDLFQQMLRHYPFAHGALMYRREAFDKVGGYRPFFKFAQDQDLLLRLADHGTYRIVPELLYQRNAPENSVNVNPEKTLMQEYYANFANQLAITRRNTGVDLLDLHGHSAAFLRRRSPILGKRLAQIGLRWRVTWNDKAGWHYLRAARDEDLSLRSRALLAIGSLPTDSWLWRKVVKPSLSELLALISYRRAKRELELQKQKLGRMDKADSQID